MNEQIRIGLTSDQQPLPVDRVADGGVLLRGESSAPPRRLLFEFDGATDVTRTRMRWIQQREGWHPWTFPLKITVENGELVVRGVEPDTLPAGLYRCRLGIDDVILPNGGRFRVTVERDAPATVTLAAKEEPRQVRLARQIHELGEGMRRVLSADGSRIDDVPVIEWLSSMRPRARRKACLLNILAKLSVIQEPLLGTVEAVFFADVDRIYTQATTDCARLLSRLADDPKKPFFQEGTPKSAVHRRMLRRAGVEESQYELVSFRQEGRYCLQVVVGLPRDGDGPHFAEFDIDLGNPLQDVAGFVVHLGEVAGPGRTDHFTLRERLLKSPARDFLCYDIVEPHVEVAIVSP